MTNDCLFNVLPRLFKVGVLFIQGCGGFPTSPPVNMTPSMLRRQLKNLVQNYSEAEVKVGALPEDIPSSFPPSARFLFASAS